MKNEEHSLHVSFTTQELIEAVKIWLTTGDLNADVLHSRFTFSSPFWKQANRQEFIHQFIELTDYKKLVLSKIKKFDPIIVCTSDDHYYFTLTLRYHTQNGCSVDEVVMCKLESGLLVEMISIYDLNETKTALALE